MRLPTWRCLLWGMVLFAAGCSGTDKTPPQEELGTSKDVTFRPIAGLTGQVSDVRVAVPANQKVRKLVTSRPAGDVDLQRMAQWAMNYLIQTPRKDLHYQPVFQCHPLRCPPTPEGQDPIVAGDTDARMDWEWYYMRDVSGSTEGKDVEAAFHERIRSYIEPDGRVWAPPGAYNEGDIHAKFDKKDYVQHIWCATKVLKSLSEDYVRTRNPQSKELARKVMLALKQTATWPDQGRCFIKCGMGALRRDGSIVPNFWNQQPAPIVEPLVTYYLATGDADGLAFAKAYAQGMMDNLLPGGIRFAPDGSFANPMGHSHATMHAVWGVAHLGVVAQDKKYLDFAQRVWTWMLSRGTGTGWFPAMPDNCNETCCASDMMSIAACLGWGGRTEYFDCVERYLRNYTSNLQFILTPEFEAYYRKINAAAGEENIRKGLAELVKFQGGIIGGSGLNDYENELLGGASGFEMFGCCAPEGMRAIYTAWSNTIDRRAASAFGPAGVYVTMSFSRKSPWGEVISFMPHEGRLTVKAAVKDIFFLRPPHWAPREHVLAFVGAKRVPTRWEGDYVRFDARRGDELTITYPLVGFTHRVEGLWKSCAPALKMAFQWTGNMVVSSEPASSKTSLFTGSPRQLPPVEEHLARLKALQVSTQPAGPAK